MMPRRTFLQSAAALAAGASLSAAEGEQRWAPAVEVLEKAVEAKQVEAAVLHVICRGNTYSFCVGNAKIGNVFTNNAMFLLGSISKPINVAALMTLFDQGKFKLDDRVTKFLPKFTGDGRDDVTIQHLLTHVSGLPDQVASNNQLRKEHAPLPAFVDETVRTPLEFAAGTKYQYSSMGILLAARIAELISGTDILTLVNETVFQPLGMEHSAQGLGKFKLEDLVPCQMEGAAPEAGGGDPTAKDWAWNSPYWRKLGAPWGGTHASAGDVAKFLDEFLHGRGKILKPNTAQLMIKNHNPVGLTPRGLGFGIGGSEGCSAGTFGHTGSTGTICWADPATDTICVVLTSFPGRGVERHPREVAAEKVAAAAKS